MNNISNSNNENFIKKPGKGWLHSDESIQDGISYTIKYIGCITVNESMKSLSFEVRTQVARESIRRIAESAKLLNLPRRSKKNDEQLNRILSSTCNTQWSGMNVNLLINTQHLKITQSECNDILFQHTMQNISFACGGDTDIKDFIAYVAKDEINGRACYVFECPNNLANSVITTVGQAFELRFRKFLNSMPNNNSNNQQQMAAQPITTNKSTISNANVSPKKVANSSSNNSNLIDTFNNNLRLTTQNQINHHLHHHHHQSTSNGSSSAAAHQMNMFEVMPSKELHNVNKSPPPIASAKLNQHSHAHHAQQHSIANSPVTKNQFQIAPTQQQAASSNFAFNRNTNVPDNNQQQPLSSNSRRIDEKLERMSWFHGLLSRENAEKLLSHNGDFLVRETNKVERQYVLSGRYKGECRHIFLVDPSGVVRTKDRTFENICHLIQYHQENRIPIISKENELLLENPISK